MWGDPERAFQLNPSDALVAVLFQVTGPAHIPWQDPRWQELLHGYNIWVHVELRQSDILSSSSTPSAATSSLAATTPSTTKAVRRQTQLPAQQQQQQQQQQCCVTAACQSLIQHAPRSSNLAALCMHVTRMLRALMPPPQQQPSSTSSTTVVAAEGDGDNASVMAFSQRIAMVGKARATAGALNLLRILIHAVIQAAASTSSSVPQKQHQHQQNAPPPSEEEYLTEVFTYHSRERSSRDHHQLDTAMGLLDALLDFIASDPPLTSTVPELYDATVLALELLTTMLSSQLYRPMVSSFERQEQQKQNATGGDNSNNSSTTMFFWDKLLERARGIHQDSTSKGNNADDRKGNEFSSKGKIRGTHFSKPSGTSTQATKSGWTPASVLKAFVQWQVCRPPAPPKSLQHYNAELTRAVVKAKRERLVADGMYESHLIVSACAPDQTADNNNNNNTSADEEDEKRIVAAATATYTETALSVPGRNPRRRSMVLDATKGVLVLSSTILLLPFRLMALALSVWGIGAIGEKGYDKLHKKQLLDRSSLTADVLWLTESPVADLSVSLMLIITNNDRAGDSSNTTEDSGEGGGKSTQNPFRYEFAELNDNRWEASTGKGLPDLPMAQAWPATTSNNNYPGGDGDDDAGEQESLLGATTNLALSPPPSSADISSSQHENCLTINFEALFSSFGRTVHTEPGALWLYTLLQSSKTFADALAVRSDLDTLILPLLRTLYFATAAQHYVQPDFRHKRATETSNGSSRRQSSSTDSLPATSGNSQHGEATSSTTKSIRNCPFRSPSQLYVIVILLLLFSQDPSFGADAFRRVMVPRIVWYKERQLHDVSLGSVLLLGLLRCLTFNLARLQDAFLLSNCCAVLMNLSGAVTDLHEYAAMRLVFVTVSTMKAHTKLLIHQQKQQQRNQGSIPSSKVIEEDYDDDDDEATMMTPAAMHGEVSRTLLRVIKQSLSAKNIERNLHLVYALVYHQADFRTVLASKECPFKKGQVSRIQTVIRLASKIIEESGDARIASKALKVLSDSMNTLKDAVSDRNAATPNSRKQELQLLGEEEITFTYEEEVDPEIFFVPYVWEVVVCAVTSSTIEWNKKRIQVFPLLENGDEYSAGEGIREDSDANQQPTDYAGFEFSKDVKDVV